MAYVFRTSGPWGAGTGYDLDPAQVDGNFWQAIQDIAAKAVQGVGISNFSVTGSQFTVVLTDHTLLGPYQLPVVKFIFKGEWVPDYSYLGGSIITHGGSTYYIPVNHTSEATFDPGANDGHGQDFYELLLQNPALTIPTGGATGTFLRKISNADYADDWLTAALNDLSDVNMSVSPGPAEGDVFTFISGAWTYSLLPLQSLATLSDVLQSPGPASNDLVYWNGSKFAYLAQSSLTISPSGLPTPTPTTLGGVKSLAAVTNSFLTQIGTDGSVSASQPAFTDISGTVAAAQLPAPTVSTLGGVESKAAVTHQFLTQIGTDGSVSQAQPAFSDISGTPTAAQTRPTTVTTLGTTGTVSLDPTLGDVFKVTPTGSITLNAATAPAGAKITLMVTTSGVSSFNVTPTTNFISTGALATGTVSGKRFTMTFTGDGTNFWETARTVAM